MKRTPASIARVLAAAAFVFFAAGTGSAPAAEEARQSAVITRLDGTASQAPSENGPWKPLRLKDEVVAGRLIRTAPSSRIELTLPDGGAVRVAPDSTLSLSKLYFPKRENQRQFEAKLLAGRIWAKVKTLSQGQSFFRVRTGNAVAGVRGTAFQVNFGQDGSLVKCYAGQVGVEGAPSEGSGAPQGPVHEVPGPHEVQGPREVSMDEWVRIVRSWQFVSVSSQGLPSDTQDIDPAADAKDEFTAWNRKLDGIEVPEPGAPRKEEPPAPPAPPPSVPDQPTSPEPAAP